MKYKYSGRVFNIKEFMYLIIDLSATPIGTVSSGRLQTDEYVDVTPYRGKWAELVKEDTPGESE